MKRVESREKTVCYRAMPVPALAGSRARAPDLESAAPTETGRAAALAPQHAVSGAWRPLPRLACGPVSRPPLALHSSGSYGYHFRSSAASRHTSPRQLLHASPKAPTVGALPPRQLLHALLYLLHPCSRAWPRPASRPVPGLTFSMQSCASIRDPGEKCGLGIKHHCNGFMR